MKTISPWKIIGKASFRTTAWALVIAFAIYHGCIQNAAAKSSLFVNDCWDYMTKDTTPYLSKDDNYVYIFEDRKVIAEGSNLANAELWKGSSNQYEDLKIKKSS